MWGRVRLAWCEVGAGVDRLRVGAGAAGVAEGGSGSGLCTGARSARMAGREVAAGVGFAPGRVRLAWREVAAGVDFVPGRMRPACREPVAGVGWLYVGVARMAGAVVGVEWLCVGVAGAVVGADWLCVGALGPCGGRRQRKRPDQRTGLPCSRNRRPATQEDRLPQPDLPRPRSTADLWSPTSRVKARFPALTRLLGD
ncbi:hypothetical protein GCM10022380_73550 [Amycolatopsis tucumanensis]|uniref:Uncharacterized protein n=1 Tax=Amycolatopsis tucumanensis TaxID=401106 RepID=A0ABP7JHJ8_9PSEU